MNTFHFPMRDPALTSPGRAAGGRRPGVDRRVVVGQLVAISVLAKSPRQDFQPHSRNLAVAGTIAVAQPTAQTLAQVGRRVAGRQDQVNWHPFRHIIEAFRVMRHRPRSRPAEPHTDPVAAEEAPPMEPPGEEPS